MSIRAHRILKIQYAETTFFRAGSTLGEVVRVMGTDHTGESGGGIIEITVGGLKEIIKDAKDHDLSKNDIINLKEELAELKKEGRNDDDYVQYDMY